MRDENEAVLQLKGLSPNGLIPDGMLENDDHESKSNSVKTKLAHHNNIKQLDQLNERMPKIDKF